MRRCYIGRGGDSGTRVGKTAGTAFRHDKYIASSDLSERNDKLVTLQHGKAAICAASSSFGNTIQRLRPERASYSLTGAILALQFQRSGQELEATMMHWLGPLKALPYLISHPLVWHQLILDASSGVNRHILYMMP